MQIEGILNDLSDRIGEVYDLDLAEEMTEIFEDLTKGLKVGSDRYWKLIGKLARIETQRDELRSELMKERKLREKTEEEKDQALYDKNYYQEELRKETELRMNVEFHRDFLMNKLTGCEGCEGCQICEN